MTKNSLPLYYVHREKFIVIWILHWNNCCRNGMIRESCNPLLLRVSGYKKLLCVKSLEMRNKQGITDS